MTTFLTDPLAAWWSRARSRPDHVALIADDGSWTDRRLMEEVLRRVAVLTQQRPKEPRLAIAVASNAERIAWMIAATWTGMPFLSVALDQPSDRIADLLSRMAPVAVLADEANAHLAGPHRLLPSGLATAAAEVDPATTPPSIASDAVAYLCFTSGSSGVPKAVEVPYGSIAHTVRAFTEYLGSTGPRDHLLATSWAFDVALLDLWLALSTTGTLIVPGGGDLLGRGLQELLAGTHQPLVQMVPSLLAAADLDPRRLPPGTEFVLGGEPASPALVQRYAHHIQLHVAYGVTEAGVCSTAYRVPPDIADFSGCIGGPLAGVELAVLARDGQETEIDDVGELHISGPGLARGYLGDPAASAGAFVSLATSGARAYRTGDLVQRDAAGLLHFRGRRDDQVQIRGHRVDPAEVETVLRTIPGIADAAVVGVHASGGWYLAAYLERRSGAESVDADRVRAVIEQRLPMWMWPRHLLFLGALPRTHTGKLARQQLPSVDIDTNAALSNVAAADEAEDTVARAWREVLGTAPRDRSSGFVAEGGTSLNAAQISAHVSQSLGVNLAVGEVLAARTFDDLVGAVRRASPRSPAAVEDDKQRASALQRDIWLSEQLEPGSGIYNLVVTIDLRPDADVGRLQRALQLLERAHPALRYGLAFDDEELVLVPPSIPVRPLSIRAIATADWEQGVDAVVREFADTEYDLEAGRLWRYELLQGNDAEATLVLGFHHGAVDGIAVQVLLQRLADLLTGRTDPADLTTRTTEAEALQSLGYRPEHLEHWRQLFRGAKAPTRLPAQADAVQGDYTADIRRFAVDRPTLAGLRAACAAHGITLQAALFACMVRWVATETANDDITLGVAVTRRGVDVPLDAIGQFAAAMPVRLVASRDVPVEETVSLAAATMRGVLDHCDVDPRDVLAIAREETRAEVGRPPFPLVFAWNEQQHGPDFAPIGGKWQLRFTGRVTYDVLVEFSHEADDLLAAIHVKRAANPGLDAEAMVNALQALIADIAHDLAWQQETRSAATGW